MHPTQQARNLKIILTAATAFIISGSKLATILTNRDNFTTLPLKKIHAICSGWARRLIDENQVPMMNRLGKWFISPDLIPTVLSSDFYYLTLEQLYQKYTTDQIESNPTIQSVVARFRIWLDEERPGLSVEIQNILPQPTDPLTLQSMFTLLRDHVDWHTSSEWRQALSRLIVPHYQTTLFHHGEFSSLFLRHLGFTDIGEYPEDICQNPEIQEFISRISTSSFDRNDTQRAASYQIGWLATHILQQHDWHFISIQYHHFLQFRPIVSYELWKSRFLAPSFLTNFVTTMNSPFLNDLIPNFQRDYQQLRALFSQSYNDYRAQYPEETDLTQAIIDQANDRNQALITALEEAGCVEDHLTDLDIEGLCTVVRGFITPHQNRGQNFRVALRAWCNNPYINTYKNRLSEHNRDIFSSYGEIISAERDPLQMFSNVVRNTFESGIFNPNDFGDSNLRPPLAIPWMLEEYVTAFSERTSSLYFNDSSQLANGIRFGIAHPHLAGWRDACAHALARIGKLAITDYKELFDFYRYFSLTRPDQANRLLETLRYRCTLDETFYDQLSPEERDLVCLGWDYQNAPISLIIKIYSDRRDDSLAEILLARFLIEPDLALDQITNHFNFITSSNYRPLVDYALARSPLNTHYAFVQNHPDFEEAFYKRIDEEFNSDKQITTGKWLFQHLDYLNHLIISSPRLENYIRFGIEHPQLDAWRAACSNALGLLADHEITADRLGVTRSQDLLKFYRYVFIENPIAANRLAPLIRIQCILDDILYNQLSPEERALVCLGWDYQDAPISLIIKIYSDRRDDSLAEILLARFQIEPDLALDQITNHFNLITSSNYRPLVDYALARSPLNTHHAFVQKHRDFEEAFYKRIEEEFNSDQQLTTVKWLFQHPDYLNNLTINKDTLARVLADVICIEILQGTEHKFTSSITEEIRKAFDISLEQGLQIWTLAITDVANYHSTPWSYEDRQALRILLRKPELKWAMQQINIPGDDSEKRLFHLLLQIEAPNANLEVWLSRWKDKQQKRALGYLRRLLLDGIRDPCLVGSETIHYCFDNNLPIAWFWYHIGLKARNNVLDVRDGIQQLVASKSNSYVKAILGPVLAIESLSMKKLFEQWQSPRLKLATQDWQNKWYEEDRPAQSELLQELCMILKNVEIDLQTVIDIVVSWQSSTLYSPLIFTDIYRERIIKSMFPVLEQTDDEKTQKLMNMLCELSLGGITVEMRCLCTAIELRAQVLADYLIDLLIPETPSDLFSSKKLSLEALFGHLTREGASPGLYQNALESLLNTLKQDNEKKLNERISFIINQWMQPETQERMEQLWINVIGTQALPPQTAQALIAHLQNIPENNKTESMRQLLQPTITEIT